MRTNPTHFILLVLLFLAILPNSSVAQMTVTPATPPLAYECIPYTLTFQLTSPKNNTAYAWSILGDNLTAIGLNGATSMTDETFVISGSVSVGTMIPSRTFKVRAVGTPDGVGGVNETVDSPNITIYLARKPVNVMLVLDRSGSMSSPACPSGCPSKMTVLKDAVTLFYDRYTAYSSARDHDRTGVIGFSSTLDISTATLASYATGSVSIPAYVNGGAFSAGGGTGMGGGIQEGINRLNSATGCNDKHIILFTDGAQNFNPMVTAGGTGIANQGGYSPPGGIVGGPYSNLNPGLGVTVSTIGIGGSATDSHFQLLGDIAANTEGVSITSPVLDATSGSVGGIDLANFYQDVLLDMLKGNSPQLVVRKTNKLSGGDDNETFPINKKVSRVVVELIHGRRDKLNLVVEKDGEDLTKLGRMVYGEFYRFFVIDFPVNGKNDGEIIPEGDWKVTISGKSGTIYKMAVVTDDHLLDYNGVIAKKDYAPGDPLELSLELDYNGSPVSKSTKVKALVFGPKDKSLATLMSTVESKGDPQGSTSGDVLTPAQAKYELLIGTTSFYEALVPESNIVNLSHDGDGKYSAKYHGTEVPGAYRVHFLIDGEIDSIGHFVREEVKGTTVDFLHAKKSESEIKFLTSPRDKMVSLYVRPKDKFKNYLGPDNSNLIQVRVNGSIQTQVKDNLDGSYTYLLANSIQKNDDVEITVNGGLFYEGTLSGLEDKWAFGIHAGVTMPINDLDIGYNQGLLGELSLSRVLSKNFSLMALGGYYGFETGTLPGVVIDDLSVVGGALYLKASLASYSSSWNLHVAGGAGFFDLSIGSDLYTGLSARAGLSKSLANHLRFQLEGAYFRLLDSGGLVRFGSGNSELEFLGLNAGLVLTF